MLELLGLCAFFVHIFTHVDRPIDQTPKLVDFFLILMGLFTSLEFLDGSQIIIKPQLFLLLVLGCLNFDSISLDFLSGDDRGSLGRQWSDGPIFLSFVHFQGGNCFLDHVVGLDRVRLRGRENSQCCITL